MDVIEWIVGQNWAGYSHQRLYDMVKTDAEGAVAVYAADEELAEFEALMAESMADVEQALAEAGVAWQGVAAESMAAGVSPLAQWAQDAGTAGQASRDSTQQIAESFSRTANTMPEPVPTPSREPMTFPPSFADLVEAQNDQDPAERESQQAKQHAVELMETYAGNSESALSTLGTFVPPQQVVATVPAQVGGVSDSAGGIVTGPAGGSDGPGGSGGRGGGPVNGGQPPVAAQPGPGAGSPGTDPARVVPPAANPTFPGGSPPPTVAPGTAPPSVVAPVAGVPGGPVAGRPYSGGAAGGGRGSGGGVAGRGPGGGGPGSGSGGGVPGRGGVTGVGPLAGDGAAGTRGGATPGARGGGFGPGMAPMGAGAGRREEDKERTSPEYLRDYRDDVWDDTDPVAPPVIGKDDD